MLQRIPVLGLVLATIIVIMSCATSQPIVAPPPQNLTITVGAFPTSSDPNVDISLIASPIYRLMYEQLVEIDDTGKPTAALAESWTQPDATTWIFKLRSGLKFANGEVVDAAAVAWNWNHFKSPDLKSRWAARFAALIDTVTAVDNLTVQFKTKQPFSTLLANLVTFNLFAPRSFQDSGQEAFRQMPVGAGAYRVIEWKQDDHVTLQASKDYWRGVPVIQTITFRLVPEASARSASLEAGESQLTIGLPPDLASPLKAKGFQVLSRSTGQSFVVILRNNVESPLKNARVRQAMNYAIDKDLIAKQLIGGYAQKLEGQIVGPSAAGYNPDIKGFPYDPAKAKALLAEAGFPNGFTVNYQTPDGRYLADKAVSQEVASQLARVGIIAKLEILESAVFVQKASTGTGGPMLNVGITWAPSLDIEAALPGFTICCATNKHHSNPRMDELFKQSQTTVDPTARAAVLKQITRLMYDDPPALYLFQIPGIYAAAKNVQGLDFRADYSIKNVLKVSIAP